MTQKSFPWPGVSPADGADAGRYTAPEWWAAWAAAQKASGVIVTSPLLRTNTAFTNIGVYYSAGNRLAVTSPAGNRINVNTGAWLADGQIGYNDTSIGSAGNITSPAANPRIDRVIVRKNYTSNTYNPASAGAEFDVPPYTARVTVIHGAEAGSPTAPTLVQDTARNPAGVFGTAGTWDIPLFQYQISVAGAITGLTDEREYVDAVTKRFGIPFTTGWNQTDGTAIIPDGSSDGPSFPDNKLCYAAFSFAVPNDFLEAMYLYHVVVAGSAGNAYIRSNIAYGTDGELLNAHSYDSGYVATALAGIRREFVLASPLASAAVGDFAGCYLARDGTNVLDTLGDIMLVQGAFVEYLGWR